MKNSWLIISLGLALVACNSAEHPKEQKEKAEKVDTLSGQKIQVALLLDTSSSMDGLIEQAKMRLWNIVNTLTTLKYEGQEPEIEIALYEYGNDGLSPQEDWIRLIVPLTQDLDEISEKLFALKTYGGTEFCGSVIQHAANNLQWNDHGKSLKLIYIAGNEEFNQEGVNFRDAVSKALQYNIFVNTIYCGAYDEGVNELWRDGATLGQGKYFNIDSDLEIQFVSTPYDDSISYYNLKLNDTYVSYSISGNVNKRKQEQQDLSNQAMSEGAYIERTISKTNSNVYQNSHWDLADKFKEDPKAFEKMKKEDLPDQFKNKSPKELEALAKKLSVEREKHQKSIQKLSKKRQVYLEEHAKKQNQGTDDLGEAIEKSILELSKIKGYSIEK